MENRPALTPWLPQLFGVPAHRGSGVGAALVTDAIAHAKNCGFIKLYLHTSRTLPQYYARQDWDEFERVEYLGEERAVMQYDITRAHT